MLTCVRELLHQGPECDVAMLRITGLAGLASVRRFKDQEIRARFRGFYQKSNSPLERYEELAFRVIQKPSNKVAVTSHPRLKMHQSIFDIAVPRLGIPNSECAQHHTSWTAQYQRQLSTSTGIFRSACTQCSVPPDYRVPRTYAARPRECLIHHDDHASAPRVLCWIGWRYQSRQT